MVEQWDCEHYDVTSYALHVTNDDVPCNESRVTCNENTPPVYTKTWFHTGFFKNRNQISDLFSKEYFKGDEDAWELPDTVLPKDLTAEEAREACRALRGSILRTEVYALDGEWNTEQEGKTSFIPSPFSFIPYTVEEKSYNLKILQRKEKNRHAIFLKTDAESLLFHYERNEDDPRILHKLVLKTDEYGNEKEIVEIAYPRREDYKLNEPAKEEQDIILATYTENEFINMNDIVKDGYWLIGVPCETKQYEIHNLVYKGNKFDAENLRELIVPLVDTCIDYAADPFEDSEVKLRLIKHERTLFWDETCQITLNPGKIASHALPYQQQTLELTQKLVQWLENEKSIDLTTSILPNTCKYLQEDDNWFAVSEIKHFSTEPNGFYLPYKITDPFGNETTIEYDDYKLFPVEVSAPLNMVTTAEYDYRVLQIKKLTDPNKNSKELEFSTLGMVSKLALVGENGEGDTLSEPTESYRYNLHCWKDEQKPVYARIKKRETHGVANHQTQWIKTYVYTDGLGNEIMTKTTAENGEALTFEPVTCNVLRVTTENRWLTSGKVIYNNKGLPVKQYEPWYSDTSEFTFEELRRYPNSTLRPTRQIDTNRFSGW